MLQPDIFSWKGALRAVGIETVCSRRSALPTNIIPQSRGARLLPIAKARGIRPRKEFR